MALMTDWIGESPRTIDELQAFDAMRLFLKAFWERGGRQSEDLALLLDFIDRDVWANGMPGDPAQWDEFRRAVDRSLEQDRQ